MAVIDVTDATFETEVLERSKQTPVVVDLWAEWCGPCRTLGPIIEKVVDATDGQVVLAKVDVDANPQISSAFQVQGIPAVYALRGGKVVDGFIGAQPEPAVQAFVDSLLPDEAEREVDALVAAGDEASLRRALELAPDHHDAIVKLAEELVASDRGDEALALLERIPETADTRRVAALARTGGDVAADDATATLDALLERVRDDEDARQQFVDLLEVLGPDDPRTSQYRRALTSRLFETPGCEQSMLGIRLERQPDCTLVISRWLVAPGASATTVGSLVFIRPSALDSARLLRHERVHLRQYRELGIVGFLRRYLADYAGWRVRRYPHRAAYRRIAFEVEAEWRARRAEVDAGGR